MVDLYSQGLPLTVQLKTILAIHRLRNVALLEVLISFLVKMEAIVVSPKFVGFPFIMRNQVLCQVRLLDQKLLVLLIFAKESLQGEVREPRLIVGVNAVDMRPLR